MQERRSKIVRGPRGIRIAPPDLEKLPELSNKGFAEQLAPPSPRREVIRYSSHARFLARWSAP
ncbi:MAG: hypothetical protein ABJC61_07495 [Acidobacteriota bacterium]